jgi:hypothetical protein
MDTQQPHISEIGATTSRNTRPCIDTVISVPDSAGVDACIAASDVTTPDDEEKRKESERQACFEGAVKKKLNIPSGYSKVAVLLVRWHESVDEYAGGHAEEVSIVSRTIHPGPSHGTVKRSFLSMGTTKVLTHNRPRD